MPDRVRKVGARRTSGASEPGLYAKLVRSSRIRQGGAYSPPELELESEESEEPVV